MVAIATNTEHVTVVDQHTGHSELLGGHVGVILCLDTSPDGQLLLSASKVLYTSDLSSTDIMIPSSSSSSSCRTTLFVFGSSVLGPDLSVVLLLVVTHSVWEQ